MKRLTVEFVTEEAITAIQRENARMNKTARESGDPGFTLAETAAAMILCFDEWRAERYEREVENDKLNHRRIMGGAIQ